MGRGKFFVVSLVGPHFNFLGSVGLYSSLEKVVEGIKIEEAKIKVRTPWFKETTDFEIRKSESKNDRVCWTIVQPDGSIYVIEYFTLNCPFPMPLEML